jgi:hypothetical protein
MPHDRFYGIAAEEIARHEVDKDLMARAYAMALGDADKTKAIYIGIRAERLEQLACELVEERQRAEEERRQEERRDARVASEARARDARAAEARAAEARAAEARAAETRAADARATEARKQEKDQEDLKQRIDAAAAAARREAAKIKEKPRPNPEDFTDPKMADAVRAMREALRVGGGRK